MEAEIKYNCSEKFSFNEEEMKYHELIAAIRALSNEQQNSPSIPIKTKFCEATLTIESGNPKLENIKVKGIRKGYTYNKGTGDAILKKDYNSIRKMNQYSIIGNKNLFILATAEAARFTHLEKAFTSVFTGGQGHEDLKQYCFSENNKGGNLFLNEYGRYFNPIGNLVVNGKNFTNFVTNIDLNLLFSEDHLINDLRFEEDNEPGTFLAPNNTFIKSPKKDKNGNIEIQELAISRVTIDQNIAQKEHIITFDLT